jgi:hypothetical protein
MAEVKNAFQMIGHWEVLMGTHVCTSLLTLDSSDSNGPFDKCLKVLVKCPRLFAE